MPYSFKDVSVGARVASNPARPYLLFFRRAPEAFWSHCKLQRCLIKLELCSSPRAVFLCGAALCCASGSGARALHSSTLCSLC